jgi:hypothetical protein
MPKNAGAVPALLTFTLIEELEFTLVIGNDALEIPVTKTAREVSGVTEAATEADVPTTLSAAFSLHAEKTIKAVTSARVLAHLELKFVKITSTFRRLEMRTLDFRTCHDSGRVSQCDRNLVGPEGLEPPTNPL